MNMRNPLWLIIALAFPMQTAFAHPVTWEGGIVVMNSFDPDRNDLHLHYSVTSDRAYSLGYSVIDDKDDERSHFILPRLNLLLKRWNKPESQANVYLWGGPGYRWTEGEPSFAGSIGGQVDYETRRIMTMLKANHIQSEEDEDFTDATYRFGVAPYLAEYDEVNTFVLGEVSYTPSLDDTWTAGPVLRLFYKNYLGEIGVRNNGDVRALLMFHY